MAMYVDVTVGARVMVEVVPVYPRQLQAEAKAKELEQAEA